MKEQEAFLSGRDGYLLGANVSGSNHSVLLSLVAFTLERKVGELVIGAGSTILN